MTNVKIQYSVDVEEIPKEVSLILDNSRGTLIGLLESLRSTIEDLEVSDNKEDIPRLIQDLVSFLQGNIKVMNRVDEMISILQGFIQIKEKPELLQQQPVAQKQVEPTKKQDSTFSDS